MAAAGRRGVGPERRRLRRGLAVATAVLLVLDVLTLAQVVRSRRPPSFDRGGAFRTVTENQPAVTTSTPLPTTAVPSSSPARPAPRAASGPTRRTAPAATAPVTVPGPTRLSVPASGVYTYDLDGRESASGFGSRPLGPTLTMVAHRGPALGPDDVVFDQEFSREHEEREIASYRPAGVVRTFEGGSLTFGPVTETSEADYDPPMTVVPHPLAPGAAAAGTSTARDPGGEVVRVEDWRSSVVGRETVTTGVGSVEAWVVRFERRSRRATSERVDQTTTYWFDPDRGVPVKWHDDVHGERDSGPATLAYDARYEVVLRGFRAS